MFEQTKTCEICQEDFIPDGKRKKRCGKKHYKKCSNCDKVFLLTSNMKPSKEFCSRKCSNENRKITRVCVICSKKITNKTGKTCSILCEQKLRNKSFSEKAEEKKCALCGNFFKPKNISQKYCNGEHYKKCVVCQQSFLLKENWSKVKTCSKKCANTFINTDEANKKRQQTFMERFGKGGPQNSEIVKQKIVKSNLDKYGVKHPMMLQETKNKVQETNMRKYGVKHTLQRKDVRLKTSETNLKRYGNINPFGSQKIQEQINKTNLKKYGNIHPNKNITVKKKRIETNLKKYGVKNVMEIEENILKAQKTFEKKIADGKIIKHSRLSKINKNFAQLLLNNNDDINNIIFEKQYGKYAADLFIKNTVKQNGVYIDIHPTISHNSYKPFTCVINGCDDNCEKHKTIDKNYHYKRALAALDNDVTLIQKYDWDSDDDLLKLVDGKIGKDFSKYSARKLVCQKISQKLANKFLKNNHIQGGAKSQTYCYGLFKTNVKNEKDNENSVNDELLAVATFGKSRFNKNYEFEFIRYAVKSGIIIHGGSGKLFKEFIDEAKPSTVVSYVDFDHTTRKHTFLNSIGFVEDKPTGPAKSWFNVNENKKVSQVSLVMQGADRLLGTNYGSVKECGLNNEQIMLREGYLPVYNSGNRVFIWKSL